MTDRATEDVSPHRHSWFVIRRVKTATGKLKELLGCRRCDATKGRFIKEQSHGH